MKKEITIRFIAKKAVLLCVFFWLFVINQVSGSHLMGGDMFYTFVSKNSSLATYQVTVKKYRDCNSTAGFDNAINYGIYNTSNSKIGGSSAAMVSGYPKSVTPSCIPKADVCIEEAVYVFTVQVPINQAVYVTTERGNRNSAIVNTSSPANYNMIWSVYIPPTNTSQNNSVTFLSQPLPYLCKGYSMSFNHLASDPDGDSLVFSLVAPYGRTGFPNTNGIAPNLITTMPWASGYSLSAPLGSGSSISVNAATGEITAYAANAGNYVIAVEVKEYRKNASGNWVSLGSVRRDLQFVVKNCTNYYPPKFVSWGGSTDKTVTLGDSICFTMSFQDTLNDSIFVTANGSIFSAAMGGSAPFATLTGGVGKNSASATVCWKPACHQVRSAPYIFTVNAADKNCGNTEKTFSIAVKAMGSSTVPTLRCADIQSNSSIALTWVNPADISNIRGYRLYRRLAGTGSFTYVDSTSGPTITSLTDNGVSNAYGNQYQYLIRSVNKCDSLSPGDTITTIHVENIKTYTYQSEARWNMLKRSFKNLYKVYYNTGQGWTLLATTADTFAVYSANRCYVEVRFKVETTDTISGCLSRSDTSAVLALEDVVIPNVMGLKVATVDSSNLIRVRWYKNDSNDVKSYLIYRKSPTQGFTLVQTYPADTAKEQSWIDSSANINDFVQTYCYKIQAIDSCGNQGAMYEEHCPCNLRGSTGNLRNTINWYPAKGNGYDSIQIFRRIAGGAWTKFRTVSKEDTMFTDTGLTCSELYTYKLLFAGNVDTSTLSFSDTIQLVPYDTIKPNSPTLTYATVTSDKRVSLYFKASTSTDVKYYDIYRSTNSGSFILLQTLTYPIGINLVYLDTTVDALQNQYCYFIIARDSCFNLSSNPTNTHCAIQLRGKSGNNKALLYWHPYKGLSPTGYNVYKWINNAFTYRYAVHNATDTFFWDSTDVVCGANTYKIEAYQTATGIITYSDSVTIYPIDTINPTLPTIKLVNILDRHRIKVDWTSSSTDVNRYILRRSVNRGAFLIIDTFGVQTSYIDSNVVTDSAVYTYSVVALDSCVSNNSGWTPPHNNIHILKYFDYCNKRLFITFNPYLNWNGGVQHYKVYRSSNMGAFSVIATLNDTVFVDSNVANNNYYRYRIVAVENGGNNLESQSDTLDLMFFPIRGPRIYSVSKSATDASLGEITIQWNAVEYDSFVVSSRLYYSSTGAPGTWSLIYNNIPKTVNSFVHKNLNTRNKDHYYYMTNVDSCGKNTDSTGIHKTMDLSVTPRKVRNRLNFTPYAGFTPCSYFILRQDTGSMRVIDTIAGTDTVYTDFPSPCNGWVHYRVGALDCNGNFLAYSDTVSLPPIDTISSDSAALNNVTITSNNFAYIEFSGNDTSDILGYVLKRSENGGPFSTVKLFLFVSAGYKYTWFDTVDVLNKTYQYRVYVLDSCLNSTPSSIFKTIQLKGAPHHLKNVIHWNTYQGYKISHQIIEYLKGATWLKLDSVSATDSGYIHQGLLCNIPWKYRITAYELGGKGRSSVSDTIHLAPFDTIAPNAVPLLQSQMISSGTQRISWNKSSPDIGWYYIKTIGSAGQTLRWDTASKSDTQIFISGLNTRDSIYTFTIIAADSCSRNLSPAGNAHSTSLISGAAGNKSTSLIWNRYQGFSNPKETIQKWINGAWVDVFYPDTLTTNWVDDSSGIGLGCGTNQYYRLQTRDQSSGRVTWSDSIYLVPFDTVDPLAPALKYASWNDSTSISIAWKKSLSADVNLYKIYRQTGSDPFVFLSDVVNDSQFTDTAITHPNVYAYYIVAVDSCDQQNVSISSDTDRTHSVYNIFEACVRQTKLVWDPLHYFESGLKEFIITARDSMGSILFTKTLPDSVLSFTDTSVILNTSRYYTISKVSVGSNYKAISYTLKVTPWIYPLPAQPRILSASVSKTGISDGEIELKWESVPVTDTLSRGYHIYQSRVGVPETYTLVETVNNVNTTSLTIDSVNTDSGHSFFYIKTFDLCDREGPASEYHKTIDTRAKGQNMQNTITWTRYEGFAVSQYEIERWDPGSPAPGLLAVVDSGTFVFVDTLVSCNNTYQYRVLARGGLNFKDLSYSDVVNATTFDTLPSDPIVIDKVSVLRTSDNIGQIELSFQGSSERNRQGYRIYRNSGAGYYRVADYVTPNNVNLTWLDNSGLDTRDSLYSYYITVFDSCGNVSLPSDTHTQINLSAVAVNHAVDLSWTKYIGWIQPFNYLVERLDPGSSTWKAVTRVPSTSNGFIDSAVICNLEYAYRISAEDTFGLVSYSDTAKVTTFEIDPPDPTTLSHVSTLLSHNTLGIIQVNWNPSISHDAESYVIYRRTANDTNYIQAGRVFRALSFEDAGLNTVDSVYFYKVIVIDSCGNVAPSFSPEHGSVVLTTRPAEQSIQLSWNHYFGWPIKHYEVWRNGVQINTISYPDSQFVDTPLSCITSMYYQLVAIPDVAGSKGFCRSDSSFDKAFDNIPPSPVYLKRATVEEFNNVVRLEWEASQGFDVAYYEIYRKTNGTNAWKKLLRTNTADTVFFDTIPTNLSSFCYRIMAADSCSNTSAPSNDACLVHLTGKATRIGHPTAPGLLPYNEITFTPYTDWKGGVDRYEIYRSDDGAPARLIKVLTDSPFTYIDTFLGNGTREFCYEILAIQDTIGYNEQSRSNQVCLVQQPIFWIPNAFSPNEDDVNDVFGLSGIFYDRYDMNIYNRWGQLIFSQSGKKPYWDGTNGKGEAVPSEYYMYQFKIYSYDGREINVNGHIFLIR